MSELSKQSPVPLEGAAKGPEGSKFGSRSGPVHEYDRSTADSKIGHSGLFATPSLAYILLEGIEIDIEVGIDPQEHGRVQRLIIDIEVGFDDKKTRIPDSHEGLQEGFNYAAIRDCVTAATRTKTYLIETIANRIADAILAMPLALTCMVKVGKKRCWTNVAMTSIKVVRFKG